MSRTSLARTRALALIALIVAAPRAGVAQEPLRVLRFQPDSNASAIAPVIISFDRPVAPKLDESVDPERLLTISPVVRRHVYWRDPSTLVAEFSSPWPAGSSYEVSLDPSLRSADGRALTRVTPWRVRVQYPRVLAVVPAGARYLEMEVVDPSLHVLVVYSSPVDTNALRGRLWFVPSSECATRDSLALTVATVRRIAADDPYQLIVAGGYDRDQRVDSLRRVVELRTSARAPRGCTGELRTPVAGSSAPPSQRIRIVPEFRFTKILTRSVENDVAECAGARCEAGPVLLNFSQSVTPDELAAHLRVNGVAPRLAAVASGSGWLLPDPLHAGERLHITIDGALTSALGERLVVRVDTSVVGRRSKPALGYAKGQVVLSRGAPQLLRVRYASADSVRVVIGRVADTARGQALSYQSNEWQNVLWSKLVADSVRRVVAVRPDSLREQILDVPRSWVPEAWRSDGLVLVRAEPVRAALTTPPATRDGITRLAPVVVSADVEREPRFAVVQRSDLSAHAALRDETLDVWVTRRSSGTPLVGARVVVYGQQRTSLGAAVSDSMGIARIRELTGPDDLQSLQTRYAEVTFAGDRVLLALPVDPYRQWEESRAPADRGDLVRPSASMGVMHGVAFSDRGIYRPGERVYVKGVARLNLPDAGFVAPRGDSARWTLAYEREGAAETITTRIGRMSEFGARSDSFDLPATARVGWYRASLALRARGGWRSVATTQFAIAEYRVPEFAVHVTADTTTPVYAGDSTTIRVRANYLFGPPMAGAAVTAVAHVYDRWGSTPQLPTLKGYHVGRWDWFGDATSEEQDQQPPPAKLGDDGSAELRVPIRRGLTRPGTLSVSVQVTDANRQTLAGSALVPIRVSDAFVGIRTDPDRVDWIARKVVPLELVTVRGDGAIRAGDTVKLVALRESWFGGRWHRDTVWRDSVVSREQPVRTSFVPAVTGWYEIVASVRDERGRISESGTYLAVAGTNDAWASRPSISFRLDRSDVSAGDTLNAIVESPEPLTAWLRLRQEGQTFWERLTTLKRGANVFRVPVPSPSLRFAELQLVGVRAVGSDSAAAPTSALPYFQTASLNLSISDSARALRVRVAAERGKYQPGDTVHVAVDVSDRAGRALRSELAVWAVDQGVVSLTGYQRPDLLAELLARGFEQWSFTSTLLGTLFPTPPALGPSSFAYWSSRRDITGAASAALLEMVTVGNAPAPNMALRRRFATTPFFAGSIVTDTSGHATASFVLPDNVTTYRLFAVAVDDELRSGSADTTIVSTRPLIVRAAMPRVVRTGDSLYAGAVLTRDGEGRTPVELKVSAEGMRVTGESVAHDTLVDARARERRFGMRVLGEDTVSVTFAAASASDRDAVLTRLPVSVAGRPRAHVAMGSIRSTGAAELDVPEGIDVTRSRLVLRSGLSPLPLLRELDARLRVYPYACTEQLSSMGRALLARVRLERSLGVTTTLAPDDRRRLELVVHELLDRQRSDGGFGYWSASNWTTPWLTSYALDVLVGARELGVAVPQGAVDKTLRYLGDGSVIADYVRRNWLAAEDTLYWPHEALHAARILRRLGHPDTALEAKVWAVRTKLDFEDRLTLALLQSEIGNAPVARKLVDYAWESVHIEGRRVTIDDSLVRRRWLFRSVTGATVALLRATTVTHPDHPLLGALLESVLQSARSDAVARWNTIDQAAVADAIAAVVAPLGLREGRQLTVTDSHGAKRTLEIAPRGEDSLSLPLASYVVSSGGRRSVRVELGSSSANAPTYYAVTLYEVPVARPVRADEEGISVERWYESYSDGKPVVEVKEGDLVRVRLRITVPRDREFVVIDDALPAGLEAVDQSLRTTGELPPYEGAARLQGDAREGPVGQKWLYGSWDGGWWTPWEHKEIRDDRVLYFARQLWRGSYQASYVARATTAGVFVRPPTQAEEMYNPAVRGRSDGGLFTVRSVTLPPSR